MPINKGFFCFCNVLKIAFYNKITTMQRKMQIKKPDAARKIPGTLLLVAMLCKVTFQIEPLKDELGCLAALPSTALH